MEQQLLNEVIKNICAQIDRAIVGAKGITGFQCGSALEAIAEHCGDRIGQTLNEAPWEPMNE